MEIEIAEALNKNSEKFKSQEIDLTQMLKVVEECFEKCVNFDDLESIILYCLEDKSGAGIALAKTLTERAVHKREQGQLKPVERFGKAVSLTIEFLIIANAFVRYQPNGKELFMVYFNRADGLASESFDYRQLAGSLYDACWKAEDPTIDPDYVRTRELMRRAVELSVQENSLTGLEDMESMAKDQINDKDFAKSITALKRKMKKANL